MGATYAEAVVQAQNQTRRNFDPVTAHAMLRQALRLFWNAWGWKETIARMEPFWTTAGKAVYAAPSVGFPADFAYVYQATHVRLNTDGSYTRRPMRVMDSIYPTTTQGLPEALAYDEAVAGFVMNLTPNENAPTAFIEVMYKKTPTDLLTTQHATTFVMERHFDEFAQVLAWIMLGARNEDRAIAATAIQTAKARDGAFATQSAVEMEGRFERIGSGV